MRSFTKTRVDSLRALCVWMPEYGELMKQVYAAMNGSASIYTLAPFYTNRNGKTTPYSEDEIFASMREGTTLKVQPHGHSASVLIRGRVISITRTPGHSAVILVLDGDIVRPQQGSEEDWYGSESKTVCYYDLESGDGFILMSSQSLAKVGCENWR
ncbi:MAG: hypothetical protein AB202_03555 [Parcubacteria bacterium C7867-007]|nr:MAG: hypothetical protein AB202_03555 [Parcubacteria bacterium C7867-007]